VAGTPAEIAASSKSRTAPYLSEALGAGRSITAERA